MEILGLLDALESMILDGTKIPFAKRVVINEEKVLAVIDKMRLVIQGGGGFAKDAIAAQGADEDDKKEARRDAGRRMPRVENREMIEGRTEDEAKAVEVLQQAYEMAREVREGADKYADEILANLEATSTRILRTVKAGRERLSKEAVASGESK
jgi:hypothetical protein